MAAIIHNSGVNYSLYYNTMNYFKTIMKNHPSIQVVTHGEIADFDTREFPSYPIANVNILTADFSENTTEYRIVLTVADKIKNLNNESDGRTNSQTIPFKGVDDTMDIHANTLSIINDLTSYTQRSVDGFEINEIISCTKFEDRFNNGLAGWVCEFTLTTHNDRNRCLFFLIRPEELNEYQIKACLSGLSYYATLNTTLNVGDVFSTIKAPGLQATYENLICYTVSQSVDVPESEIVFSNLPVLPLPLYDYGTCETCELWINPKIWNTTPAKWGQVPLADFRTWSTT